MAKKGKSELAQESRRRLAKGRKTPKDVPLEFVVERAQVVPNEVSRCRKCKGQTGTLRYDPESRLYRWDCSNCGYCGIVCGAPPRPTERPYLPGGVPREQRTWRCGSAPMRGRTRCKFHGGKTPKGIGHPNFKHGGYSAHLPSRLAARYEEAMRDTDLLSARSEVALLHVRIQELTRRLRTGESGSHWANLKATYEQLERAARAGDHETVKAALSKIGEIIKAGAKVEHVWQDLTAAIEDKTRVATRENQRMKDLHQMMTVEQAMRLVGSLVMAVQKHVQDRQIQNAIGREIGMVLSADGGFRPVLPIQQRPGTAERQEGTETLPSGQTPGMAGQGQMAAPSAPNEQPQQPGGQPCPVEQPGPDATRSAEAPSPTSDATPGHPGETAPQPPPALPQPDSPVAVEPAQPPAAEQPCPQDDPYADLWGTSKPGNNTAE